MSHPKPINNPILAFIQQELEGEHEAGLVDYPLQRLPWRD